MWLDRCACRFFPPGASGFSEAVSTCGGGLLIYWAVRYTDGTSGRSWKPADYLRQTSLVTRLPLLRVWVQDDKAYRGRSIALDLDLLVTVKLAMTSEPCMLDGWHYSLVQLWQRSTWKGAIHKRERNHRNEVVFNKLLTSSVTWSWLPTIMGVLLSIHTPFRITSCCNTWNLWWLFP